MGACCTARAGDRESDLPAPKIEGNAFEKFEKSFPFSRTYCDTFEKRVRAAAKKTGEDGKTVTLEALREVFVTGAWAELKQDDSRLCRLLKTSVFTDPRVGAIDVNSLILFGILNCPGDAKCKSEVLYKVFQEGGFEK